eukprot:7321485-Pyramimonas_sp.AAC.1
MADDLSPTNPLRATFYIIGRGAIMSSYECKSCPCRRGNEHPASIRKHQTYPGPQVPRSNSNSRGETARPVAGSN